MKKISIFYLFFTIFITQSVFSQIFSPINLKCEYLVNPLGIDEQNPRFTWQIKDNRNGAAQTFYQLIIDTSIETLNTGENCIWNTGKVSSDSNLIVYKGAALQPFTRYYWKVVTGDKDGKVHKHSEIAFFETGMMNTGNWKGSWISDGIDEKLEPAPYFRKSFTLTKVPVSARAYIAVAGLYELYINGEKIGNHKLDPSFTRYDRRNLYVTYDITPYLKYGKNTVGVLLGNGWYNHQAIGVWGFEKAPWRNRPTFCMDVRVTNADGTEDIIATDRTWKTALSPVIYNNIYSSERFDANKIQEGWNTANFSDTAWNPAIYRLAPSRNIVAQVLYPIRETEKIAAARFKKFNDKNYVYDLNRNISGIAEISVKGDAGTVIKLTYSENIDSIGHADLSNINRFFTVDSSGLPFQTDMFILSGKGIETFKPRFTYKGFQYVEVISSKPIVLTKNSLVGYFMHSDAPASGSIKTSDPLLSSIWKATNNSYLSNLFGYPTDCPQREKNGWTGDAHIAIETGLYNFDAVTIYEKWMADHRDEQQPNGVLPAIIPTSGWGYQWANGVDWTSTIAIVPWTLYLFYGDIRPLQMNYENLKRYVDHINDLYPAGLTTWGLGDWVPLKSVSSVELTSSIYYFITVDIASKAADLLKRSNDFKKYRALAERIKNAINKKYLNSATAIYGSGFQTELSMPLYWGIVPEKLKQNVADNLAKRVTYDGYKVDAGILGTKAILNALSENGYADLAYKLATRKEFPSWGWWIVNGATTLYENWDVLQQYAASLNHIMFGDISAWMYKALGGIYPESLNPGFKTINLKPNFVTGLKEFTARHNSPFGEIISSWRRNKTSVDYNVQIPPNCNAVLQLKAKSVKMTENGKSINLKNYQNIKLGTGSHSFKIQL